jgi:hypothetical protein
VVSSAAGSVGSMACQIGKLKGAKVVGIAGTDEKCRWLKEDVKVDAALNYKSPTIHDEFKDAVGYLDVFFDNVGGEILDFALTRSTDCLMSSKHKKLFTVADDVCQVPSVRSLLSRCRLVFMIPRYRRCRAKRRVFLHKPHNSTVSLCAA